MDVRQKTYKSILSLAWMVLCLPIIYTTPVYSAPKRMVEIQATIFEYRLTNEKQLGIFYQYNRIKGSRQNTDVFLHGTENPSDTSIPALDLSGSFAKISYGSIDYNIRTAIEEGRATVISNPTILTADGEPGSLSSGERVPITIMTTQGNNTKLKLEFRNTGIRFNVTPRIFKQDYVMMNIEIESSEITGFQLFDRGDLERFELPIITTRTIQTAVILPAGSPLYIGGLYTKNAGDVTRKIPILGDVPGIGFFLRGFNKKRQDTETIFRITPIIREPGKGLDPAIESSIFHDLLNKDTGNSAAIYTDELSGAAISSPTDVINHTKRMTQSAELGKEEEPAKEEGKPAKEEGKPAKEEGKPAKEEGKPAQPESESGKE